MFLKILRFLHIYIDENINFPMMYSTQLYVNLNSSYGQLKIQFHILPEILRRHFRPFVVCSWTVHFFLEKSKKLVAYFYGPYLENVKTQMYDILNISVLYIFLIYFKTHLTASSSNNLHKTGNLIKNDRCDFFKF